MPLTHAPVNVASTGFTKITAQTWCQQVRVCEVNQAGTIDYYLAAPTSSDGPKTLPAGKEYQVNGPFSPGDTVCFLKAVTGSANFDVIEDSQANLR